MASIKTSSPSHPGPRATSVDRSSPWRQLTAWSCLRQNRPISAARSSAFDGGARSRPHTGMARGHPRPPREWSMLARTEGAAEEGQETSANASRDDKDIDRSVTSAVGSPTPAEPPGSAGAVPDDMLVELVGQDYGMMAMLRNDKFKSLIVFLRNIPPNEWVSEVAKAYPGDDEVKGMLGQVGKLMRMRDYYESKNPNKK